MAAQMTASDLALWRAFYADMPDRNEFYLSQICELIAKAVGMKKKDGGELTRADFAPDLRTPAERMAAHQKWVEAQAAFKEAQRQGRERANGKAA